MFLRESAITLHFFARAKPGINRLTACNPNPVIPNRTIGASYFVNATERGTPPI